MIFLNFCNVYIFKYYFLTKNYLFKYFQNNENTNCQPSIEDPFAYFDQSSSSILSSISTPGSTYW
jgi:hypothetical protein